MAGLKNGPMIAKISGNSFCYAIFSGGNSSRMGYDKSLLSINGQTVIQRIVGDIQNPQLVDGNTFIASNAKKYTQLKDDSLIYIEDYLDQNQGPLSALAAVFAWLKNRPQTDIKWVLTFPCDTLLLPSETIDLLKQAMIEMPSSKIIYLRGERDHPLHGAYHIDVADNLFNYLNRGQRSVMGFIQGSAYHPVTTPKPWDDYFNFNTKPEFQHACDIFQGKIVE